MDKLRSSVAIPFARPDLPTYLQITSGSKLSAIDLWRQNDRQVLPQEMLRVQSSSGWGQEAGHAARGTGSMDSWAGSAAGTLSMVQFRYAVAMTGRETGKTYLFPRERFLVLSFSHKIKISIKRLAS